MNNEKKENLASEVQKWPLLYDKSDKNYKNSVGGSGLGKIAENMGMEGLFLLIKPCAVLLQHDGGGPTSTSTTRHEKNANRKHY